MKRTVFSPPLLAAFLTLALFAPIAPVEAAGGADKHSGNESLFFAAEYLEHVSYLASNELEGRGTGQEGIDKAAEYIAEYFQQLGVQPAGDDGTYFQQFGLKLKNQIGPDTSLSSRSKGRKTWGRCKLESDYVPLPFSGTGGFEGQVVFAGYGVANEELDYDDYDGIDVADKVVLVFRRAPTFDDFTERDKTFQAKASRANALDAAAVLVVNPIGDEAGDTLYDFSQRSPGFFGFGRQNYGIPMIHVTQGTANRLLKAGGLPDLATLQKRIEDKKKPASAPLKGVFAKGTVDIQPVETPVRNVVGMIPGVGPNADEIIVLGAHYDHLGVRNKGEANFDPEKHISNGADDNASGTSLVMQLAKAYTHGEKPNRSLLLIAFTAEEMGLLGSAHFAHNPTVDLDQCIAMLNFDMVGRLKNNKLEIGGMRTGGFEEPLRRLADKYELKIVDGGGGSGPSDHTSFYQEKIPVLFFFTGLHKQYHQPTDDSNLINADGAMTIGKLAADFIDEIDAASDRPTFQADTRDEQLLVIDEDESERDRQPARDRVRLGVTIDTDDGPGVLIGGVSKDSPADRAGIKDRDRIVKIGDTAIDTTEDLIAALGKLKQGDAAVVEVQRRKKTLKLQAQFGQPRAAAAGNQQQALIEFGEAIAKLLAEHGTEGKLTIGIDGAGDLSVQITQDADTWADLLKAKEGKEPEPLLESVLTAFGHDPKQVRIQKAWATLEVARKGVKLSFSIAVEPPGQAPAADSPKPSPKKEKPQTPKPKQRQKPAAKPQAKAKQADPHGDVDEAAPSREMPPVRLGIMPTYGEQEGEGYEISGVTEGGPAAKAGVKDSDRIYQIGDHVIKDVYSYMDALRKYKPGDEIPVVVLRDGKKITLKIKAEGPKEQGES